jgi:phenylacetate-CoA ligase
MRIVTEISEQGNMPECQPLAAVLSKKIKRELMVTPEVELVPYGSLPRSERKSQRVFDTRIQDSII